MEFDCLKKVLVIGEPFEGIESFSSFTGRERPDFDEALLSRASQINDEDEILLLYTSGSTGKPKGVVRTHRSIVENIKVEIEKFYFGERSLPGSCG